MMEQTELYTRCIRTRSSLDAQIPHTPSKRLSRAEKDEDDELVQTALDEVDMSQTHFDESPPFIKNGSMKTYQVDALNWLIRRHDGGINSILADEMGLGKTLETIALFGYLYKLRHNKGPHIVVAPKSTLHGWETELHRWAPYLNVIKLIGSKEDRPEIVAQIRKRKFNVVLTSYEIAKIEQLPLRKIKWSYLVIDEAHRIKNEHSLLSQLVRKFDNDHRLLLTGTPLQNNLHELWALLNFLLPEVFDSAEDFDEWFQMDAEHQADTVQRLHTILKPFMLRRTKVDVEKSLPPKKEIKVFVRLSTLQTGLYRSILKKERDVLLGVYKQRTRLLNMIMQLRKACNHPYLFHEIEPGPPYVNGEYLVTASGKMVVLDKLLQKLKAQNSRVLVFSQMTRMLDIIEDYIALRGWTYVRIDGSTDTVERDKRIDEFNAKNSPVFLFLLSTRAGGLGINLATADQVIIYDSDWNPQMDLQASDRAHRIGQVKPVTVYRFVTEYTVEEKIVQRAEKRLCLDAVVIQQGRLAESSNKAVKFEELLSMVHFGADQVLRSTATSELTTNEDIDQILAQAEQKTAQQQEEMQENVKKMLDFSGQDEFDIHDFDKKTSTSEIAQLLREGDAQTSGTNNRAAAQQAHRRMVPLRPLRQPTLQPWQFYPERLFEILKKERTIYKDKIAAYEALEDAQSSSEKTLVAFPDDLTEAEIAEKEKLLTKGYTQWSYRDFFLFIHASKNHGRKNLKDIAAAIPGKSLEEVKEYSEVFWSRIDELKDSESIKRKIEKGEEKREQIVEKQKLLDSLPPFNTLVFRGPTPSIFSLSRNNKHFSYTSDIFLLTTLRDLGYGKWDHLKECVLRSDLFRFDWFLQSRTAVDLHRRCDVLVKGCQKKQEQEKKKRKERKKKEKEKEREKAKAKAKKNKKRPQKVSKKEKDKKGSKSSKKDKTKHKHKDKKHHKSKDKASSKKTKHHHKDKEETKLAGSKRSPPPSNDAPKQPHSSKRKR
ncbi:chromatin-remodeling complex ATPase chain Iswi [Pelomyxa schiedti]|nr:chromatin-remodeling complex ATPase chain Iswi [Pelomyxa schiedti]